MPELATVLAAYGAVVATIVAGVQIRAYFREKPRLSISPYIPDPKGVDAGEIDPFKVASI